MCTYVYIAVCILMCHLHSFHVVQCVLWGDDLTSVAETHCGTVYVQLLPLHLALGGMLHAIYSKWVTWPVHNFVFCLITPVTGGVLEFPTHVYVHCLLYSCVPHYGVWLSTLPAFQMCTVPTDAHTCQDEAMLRKVKDQRDQRSVVKSFDVDEHPQQSCIFPHPVSSSITSCSDSISSTAYAWLLKHHCWI